jgi:hydroxymethylpyrimidine pyrophosphatase-like HAD family hydrolase
VRTLPIDGSPALLLSFDFDGTLHDPSGNPPVSLLFFEAIQWLRTARNAVWGINTGRSMEHLLQGMIESRFPFLPDFVVVREREIFLPNPVGRFVPVLPWNAKCEVDLQKLLKKSGKILKQIRGEVAEHTGAEWIEQAGEPAGIISRTDLEMDWIVARIREIVAPASELGWQRNSIYLRFGHKGYQKGSSLAEVARMFGLGAEQTFAMGDSHNDLEMLDVGVARSIACPMNSVEDVKQHVHGQQGYLSSSSYSVGVVEALAHYFE